MSTETEIIYNGSCPICSREIAGYRRYAESRALPLRFTDLTRADLVQYGLSPDDAARELHVLRDGTLLRGVDAFVALWSEMPRFRWLAWLVSRPGLNRVARWVYSGVLAPLLYGWHRRRLRRQAQI